MGFPHKGETPEEAKAKYKAEHPDANENDIHYTFCWDSYRNQEDDRQPPSNNQKAGADDTGGSTAGKEPQSHHDKISLDAHCTPNALKTASLGSA